MPPKKPPVKPVPAKPKVTPTQKPAAKSTTKNQTGPKSQQSKPAQVNNKQQSKAAPENNEVTKIAEVKKWTKEDEAARTIQCGCRQFVARKELERRRKQKKDYEETMERLEKEAFVALVRMEQERLRKEQEKEDEERRRKREQKKREARMLEAAFDGDNDVIKTVLAEVSEMDDQAGILKEGFGGYLRKRHQLEMVDCRDANGNSPLSEAAAGGHQSTILMLTEKGADVNSRGQFERTPLYRAAFAGNLAAAQVLLTQGADPRLYASDGMQPQHVAASDDMKNLLEEWDISVTERLLESLQAEIERRRREDKATCESHTDKMQSEVDKAQKIYQSCQKQLENALCELNRRIYEHDKCVRKHQEKIHITLKAIEDAQEKVDEKQVETDKAKDRLDRAKVSLREQKRTIAQAERMDSGLDAPDLPGEKVAVRELDDVLLRDVGNKIASNPKWPLLIDMKGQASTFLRYRDTNYLMALSPQDMETESLRMALLGALRFGKPFVIDMMQVEMLDTVCDRLNEIGSSCPDNPTGGSEDTTVSQMLIDKTIAKQENFRCLLRENDSKEYKLSNFTEDKLSNFKFFLITKLSQPSETLLEKFNPLRVHIPGADAFADID